MAHTHEAIHKELNDALNELLADFFSHSAIPPHTATIGQLMQWSKDQTKKLSHPDDHDYTRDTRR